MLHALKLHPDSLCAAVARIDAGATRSIAATLSLRYVMTGKIAELRLPAITASIRADELWRHTCCEAFVAIPDSTAYYEFNFSPSTQWAAYRFNAYRKEMHVVDEIGSPHINVYADDARFELQVLVDCSRLPELASHAGLRLGLSTVIEERSGRNTYWALAHPPGKPDFHHATSFAIELER